MGIPDPDAVDVSALTEPVDRSAVRAFRATLPAAARPSKATLLLPLIAAGYTTVFAIAWTIGVLVVAKGAWTWDQTWMIALGWGLPAIGWFLVAVALRRHNGVAPYRLHRFAAANGFGYEAVGGSPAWPGLIFSPGYGKLAYDLIRVPQGPTIGNHTFFTGSGRSRRRHLWGFASVSLGTRLPHIVMDATGNNSWLRQSQLPVPFGRAQRLELEGDFARHFEVYCPVGYEADALYLLTPDIMARLVDHAAELDVEIVDDRLYVYAPRALSTTDPQTWEWLFTTLTALTARVDQWRRWRDKRLGDDTVKVRDGAPRLVRPPAGVAEQGRRLARTRRVWVGILWSVLLVLVGVVPYLGYRFGLWD